MSAQVNGSVVKHPECWTVADAINMVSENYVIVNLDFAGFTEKNYKKQEEVSLATVVGTIGGNLGLFMGFSIMTVVEWLECAFFLVLTLPYILFRWDLFPCLVRPTDDEEEQEHDEEKDKDKAQHSQDVVAGQMFECAEY